MKRLLLLFCVLFSMQNYAQDTVTHNDYCIDEGIITKITGPVVTCGESITASEKTLIQKLTKAWTGSIGSAFLSPDKADFYQNEADSILKVLSALDVKIELPKKLDTITKQQLFDELPEERQRVKLFLMCSQGKMSYIQVDKTSVVMSLNRLQYAEMVRISNQSIWIEAPVWRVDEYACDEYKEILIRLQKIMVHQYYLQLLVADEHQQFEKTALDTMEEVYAKLNAEYKLYSYMKENHDCTQYEARMEPQGFTHREFTDQEAQEMLMEREATNSFLECYNARYSAVLELEGDDKKMKEYIRGVYSRN